MMTKSYKTKTKVSNGILFVVMLLLGICMISRLYGPCRLPLKITMKFSPTPSNGFRRYSGGPITRRYASAFRSLHTI